MNKKNELEKIKLLVTITQRGKAGFYIDVLEQYNVNVQMLLRGHGSAPSNINNMWGVISKERDVILSFIKEDETSTILKKINDKFEQIKQGKGVAFVLPLQSVVGVSTYQFLMNNRNRRED